MEETAIPTPVERAEVSWKPSDGHRFGLGQIIALGLVRQYRFDHVERNQVGWVAFGPPHPGSDQRPRRQVNAGGVLFVTRQHQNGQRSTSRHLDPVSSLDRSHHRPGGATPGSPGRPTLLPFFRGRRQTGNSDRGW
jgi:hypothetical protein